MAVPTAAIPRNATGRNPETTSVPPTPAVAALLIRVQLVPTNRTMGNSPQSARHPTARKLPAEVPRIRNAPALYHDRPFLQSVLPPLPESRALVEVPQHEFSFTLLEQFLG